MSASASVSAQDPAGLAAVESPRRWISDVLRIGAPLVYVAALAITVASWGLPVARDQLFFWVLLGLAAFSVTAWRTWGAMLLGWLPLLALLVVYDYLRGAVAVVPGRAHVATQIAVDRWLAGGADPTRWLQRHLWSPAHPHVYDYGVWAVYMTHFFVIWLVAAWLWRASRPRFARYAALTVVLTIAAFLVYWRYPAQPPWMAVGSVDRIVPTIWDQLGVRSIQSVYENGDLVNTVAAMPSLHAAYPMMMLLFFWGAGRRVRAGLALYAVAMGFALVYSGEHFVSDILAGWVLACAAYVVVVAALRVPLSKFPARRALARYAPPLPAPRTPRRPSRRAGRGHAR